MIDQWSIIDDINADILELYQKFDNCKKFSVKMERKAQKIN